MLPQKMLSQVSLVTEQLASGVGLLHLVLLGVAIVAYLLLRRKKPESVAPAAERSSGASATLRDAPSPPGLGKSSKNEDPFFDSLPKGKNERLENIYNPPAYWHVSGVIHSGEDRELVHSDPVEPFYFENEYCTGLYFPMFRPTADPSCEGSGPGKFPYTDHFKGRKRLWEQRLQIKLKQPIDGDGGLRFGILLSEYVPLGRVNKSSMKMVVGALRRVVGADLYHSPGEAEGSDGKEAELPTFVLPLWAFDQFIVTPEGDEPPDLTDAHFCDYGHHRVADRRKFIEDLSQLELKPGPTYTFSFWGISQFVDAVRWTISKGVPMSIDFNTFCKRPPVTVCMYTLKKGSTTKDDQRHLESRKKYLFRVEFWSNMKPPARQIIKDLFPKVHDVEKISNGVQAKKSWFNFMACCSARTQ